MAAQLPDWVIAVAPLIIFLAVAVILWGCLRSSGAIMRLVGKGIEAILPLNGDSCWCVWAYLIINGVLKLLKRVCELSSAGTCSRQTNAQCGCSPFPASLAICGI